MIASPQAESRTVTPAPARSTAPIQTRPAAADIIMPVSLLELELSLAAFDGDDTTFDRTVRSAAQAAGGELLFELPASGLLADCRKIAVIRIPSDGDQSRRIALAVLDAAGSGIRIEEADDATAGLVRFAEAFVDVLKRI